MPTGPHGSWSSPISASLIVEQAVAVGELAVGTDDVWWSELRPAEGGRVVIVRHRPGGQSVEVLPEGFSARTRVHEYGGGAWWLHTDSLFFVNWDDQRVYRIDGDLPPRPLTPEPASPGALRYADGRPTADGRWVVCVRESHPEGSDASGVVNEIVAFDAHDGGEPQVLVTGPDFVSFPRLSPDGHRLAWTQWNHPDMPWDATELWVGDLVDDSEHIRLSGARRVAGGPDESIFQPEWDRDGSLLFVSDRTDWWNLYRIDATDVAAVEPSPHAFVAVDGEIGVPQWVFDQSRYAVLADGRVAIAYAHDGVDHLGVMAADGSILTTIETPFTALSSLRALGSGLVAIGGRPDVEPTVALFDLPAQGVPSLAELRRPRDLGLDPDWVATPESLTFETTGGAVAHALYYPPTNPEWSAPEGDLPPLVVLSHGGPTSAARPQLNLTIQYWTSRGMAVVDVNYRGSTGYGRAYRHALDGSWGVTDVDDCAAAAVELVDTGAVDGERLAIRGGSAGGYTTLCALTFRSAFRAGASLYGVADLEALARDTHKFELRYLDRLVGPYPEARDTYVARSPIHHTGRLDCPLILFQGTEDEVVPPAQAETMVAALAAKGLPYAYVAFEGEQHGFRRAATIERVLEAELYFYSRVFGFELADQVEPVEIHNL